MNQKEYRWKETWRDHWEFDWLCEMETCEEAIDSMRAHIENCDRRYDASSINNAHSVISDIEEELEIRDMDWPTQDDIEKFCGIYPVLIQREINMDIEPFIRPIVGSFGSVFMEVPGESWKLTPEILKTRWTSYDDMMQWLIYMSQCRIEPMPMTVIDNIPEKKKINIGWDPYDLG